MGLDKLLEFDINKKNYEKQLHKENNYFKSHLEVIELFSYETRELNLKKEEVKYVWSCYPEIKNEGRNQNFYKYFVVNNE